MRLSVKMLDSSSTLNRLVYVDEVYVYPGETAIIFLQLQDDVSKHRYIPAAGASVNVKMYAINDNDIILKSASNPFLEDRSIWSFSLNAAETARLAGVNLEVTLTEGAQIKKTFVNSAVIVYPLSPYQA